MPLPDLAAALASLPHGPSFRFVDSLESLEPGVSAIGTYQLRSESAFLAGHFPGHPIMPGVLMVEAIAQMAGIAAQTAPDLPPLIDLRLAAIRQIKIHGSVGPGCNLRIHAVIGGRMNGLVQASGTVHSPDGTLLAEGQITLSGQAAPSANH